VAPSIENPWQDAENVRQQERKRPGALLARRTRTIRMCSFDARSKGQPWPLPLKDVYEGGGSSLATRTDQLWYDAHAPDLEETGHFGFLFFLSKTSWLLSASMV